jgi:hypothetical protein
MSEALPAILADGDGLRAHSRDALRSAIDRILRAAVAADLLRDDVPAEDVVMAIGGVTLIAGHEHQRAFADRLLDLLMAALHRRP